MMMNRRNGTRPPSSSDDLSTLFRITCGTTLLTVLVTKIGRINDLFTLQSKALVHNLTHPPSSCLSIHRRRSHLAGSQVKKMAVNQHATSNGHFSSLFGKPRSGRDRLLLLTIVSLVILIASAFITPVKGQKQLETIINADVDIGWTLINGALVMCKFSSFAGFELGLSYASRVCFIFQISNNHHHHRFAFLEAGSIRSKNVANILLKIVMSVAISTMAWFTIGYGLAFGDNKSAETRNGFFGNSSFFLLGTNETYHIFFFQWSFAAVASTSKFQCCSLC